MNTQHFNHLKDLLARLSRSSGHFIIESGEYYCQFQKELNSKSIRFEAQSPYFNDKLDARLTNEFATLGFGLAAEENYSKDIILNSETDVVHTAKEVEFIFEQLYRVEASASYCSDDQIEQSAPETIPTPDGALGFTKKDRKMATTILMVIAVGYAVYYFGYRTNTQQAQMSVPVVENHIQTTNYSKTYLLLSADEFKTNFNRTAHELNISYRIKKLNILKGVNNSFKYCFSENLCLVGNLDGNTNQLIGVYLIGQGDGYWPSTSKILDAVAVLISAIDPTLGSEGRSQISEALGMWDAEADLYNLTNSVVRNGIKYTINSSPQTGIMVGAELPN